MPVPILIQYTTRRDASTHIDTIYNKERYEYSYLYNTQQGEIPVPK